MTWDCLLHTILDRVTFSRHVLVLKNHTNKNKKKNHLHTDEQWVMNLGTWVSPYIKIYFIIALSLLM